MYVSTDLQFYNFLSTKLGTGPYTGDFYAPLTLTTIALSTTIQFSNLMLWEQRLTGQKYDMGPFKEFLEETGQRE